MYASYVRGCKANCNKYGEREMANEKKRKDYKMGGWKERRAERNGKEKGAECVHKNIGI